MLVFCRGVLSRYHCKWTSYQCTNLELIQPFQRAFVQRYKKVSACDCFLMMLHFWALPITSKHYAYLTQTLMWKHIKIKNQWLAWKKYKFWIFFFFYLKFFTTEISIMKWSENNRADSRRIVGKLIRL